ncbi:MAG: protein phosphatase 2C domain-containing protein [Nitrospirae bacterium]|nr:protein phosphatase 2C domain-containing protein [Nitrospirota bacterium]
MKATSRSDRGTKRRKNRDAVLIDCEREMFFLADGLGGGHPAGEIASDTSVRTAYDYLKDRLHDETDIKHLLAEAVKHAHHCLQKLSGKDRTLKGMGTTIVLMIIRVCL